MTYNVFGGTLNLALSICSLDFCGHVLLQPFVVICVKLLIQLIIYFSKIAKKKLQLLEPSEHDCVI